MPCSSNRLRSPLRCSSEHCTIKILKARVRFCWIKQLPNSAERTHIGKRNKSRPLEGFQIIIRHGKINGYRHIRAHRSLTMADPRGQTHSLVDQSQVEICSDAVAPGQTSSSLQGKLPVVVAFGRSNNTATLHIRSVGCWSMSHREYGALSHIISASSQLKIITKPNTNYAYTAPK